MTLALALILAFLITVIVTANATATMLRDHFERKLDSGLVTLGDRA